jgi:segregation and condensation protein B
LLFVGVTPLTAERACEVIRGLDPEQFRRIIDQLNRVFRRQNRPYTIQATEKGWVLVLRNPYRRLRERLVGSPRAVRLSGPAMDVLAIVAYRQPINKRDIDTLRGQESGAVLRSLVRLGVVSVGQRGDGSSELCYRTTQRFLEVFGLRKLSDLPQSDDFSRL